MDFSTLAEIKEEKSIQLTSFEAATRQKTVTIEPGTSREITSLPGCGMVTRLWVTFPGWFWRHWDPEAENDASVLRLTLLKIYFDGEEKPSVMAPIGDFFGIGHCEYRHYTAKCLGMSSGGFYSYFPMPFQNGIRVEVVNLHPSIRIDLFYNINVTLLDRLPQGMGRFHAAFHYGKRCGEEPLDILDVSGKGHYLGCSLSIQGEPLQYLTYLEAPEYIHVDGDPAYSMCGTGMEDYFNGGWYFRNGEFYCDTHGIPIKDSLRSMVSMYRFHEQDRINFSKSFQMYFLHPWDKERLKPVIYSSVAYYFMDHATPAAEFDTSPDSLTELYRRRDFDVASVP